METTNKILKGLIYLFFLIYFFSFNIIFADGIKKNKYIEVNDDNRCEALEDFYFNYKIYKKGARNINILKIKCSMLESGYDIKNLDDLFDDNLVENIKRLQNKIGVKENGFFTKKVWLNLNNINFFKDIDSYYQAINEIANIIYLNDNTKYVVVNIPEYKIYGLVKNLTTNEISLFLESKAIVGSSKNQTPLDNVKITQLKFNPEWNLPYSALKSFYYIDETGKKVLDRERLHSQGYTIRENGSVFLDKARSPLGKLKFDTDSTQSIYLHDTNKKSLFNNENRALSLGCVRVEKYKDFAYWLSGDSLEIDKRLKSKNTTYYRIDNPIPVMFVYSTAIPKSGIIDDINKRIKELQENKNDNILGNYKASLDFFHNPYFQFNGNKIYLNKYKNYYKINNFYFFENIYNY